MPDMLSQGPQGDDERQRARLAPLAQTAPFMGDETRPLRMSDVQSSMSSRMQYGHATSVGRVRSKNEDSLLTFVSAIENSGGMQPVGIFVVADGIGGHLHGELASTIAATTLVQHTANHIYSVLLAEAQQSDDYTRLFPEALADGIQLANRAVVGSVPDGGTTITAAVIWGAMVHVAHVGDSRAYLISDGNMQRITRDHSLVWRLVELGHLTEEEAQNHPDRNILYCALGEEELTEVDLVTRSLPPGSQLLLCSDGLWGEIGEDAMLEIIEESTNPQEACDRLVAAANKSGGRDNITAILIQMHSGAHHALSRQASPPLVARILDILPGLDLRR